MSILKNKKADVISKIIFGALMVGVFSFVFGPAVFAQFNRLTNISGSSYGYDYGYGYGYGYGFGTDGGATGYRSSNSVVDLGAAKSFAVLSYAGVNDVPTSHIIGNVGVSPDSGSTIGLGCPEVSGTIYSVDGAGPSCKVTNASLLTTAMTNLGTAVGVANGLPTSVLDENGGELGGKSLAPGVYTFDTSDPNVTISTNLTLAGGASGVWVFQIPGTFIVSAGVHVNLTGGALPDNVFWVVHGAVTLHENSVVNGSILGHTSIAMLSGATLNGSAMAETESVTLSGNTITLPASLYEYGVGYGYLAAPTYTLTYTPGANGTISGTSPQTVVWNTNGSAVTAVPASGYQFVNWSDSSTANPRTDTNVTGNVTVTANFSALGTSGIEYGTAGSGGGGSSGGGGGGYYNSFPFATTTGTGTGGGAASGESQQQVLAGLVTQLRTLLLELQSRGVTLTPAEIAFLNGTTSLSAVTRDLTLGSTGADVSALQTFLIGQNKGPAARALAAVGATGYFGSLTQAALAEYQAAVGITPPAGYFGPRTRAYLQSIGISLTSAGTGTTSLSAVTRDLTLGSTGADVSALQMFLISENKGSAASALAAVGATGYFGSLTQAALAEYQAAVGITPPAGYFGPRTRAYLQSIGQ